MTPERNLGGVAGMGSRGRSILPLPDDVIAQLKSSTAIVSLTAVILGLLKNALDAKATKIHVTADFVRGGCTIEDNGLGIAPSEFREDGGLGKLYCTSKYHSEEACLGRHGTFLASLAAVSLLTITSRHHENRSNNLMTIHHSRAIDRQLPASSQHEIHKKHGTRVTVRNLFGNLPVRVKHRAIISEQKAEHDRLWDILKREVTGLLLSWRRGVTLRARDAEGKTVLNFSNATHTTDSTKPRSAELVTLLHTLTQGNYILPDEWSSWVPASASTASITIKGAISLEPAPSRQAQFISLGIRPLSAESGHNTLYDEVNRLFSMSNFGTVEEDADVGGITKTHRQGDKRFKNEGYTNRQLSARKGIDRYPMFHLRISLKSGHSASRSEGDFIEDETNLQAVVEVLHAMITEWLSVHHFRPRKPRIRRDRLSTGSTPTGEPTEVGTSNSQPWLQSSFDTRRSRPEVSTSSTSNSVEPESRKRKRLPSNQPSVRVPSRAFADWSRIKSGKADFFDTFASNGKYQSEMNSAEFNVPPILPGSLDRDLAPQHSVEEQIQSDGNQCDGTMTWTDPSTKHTFLLNARTGCVLPRLATSSLSDLPTRTQETTLDEYNKVFQIAKKPETLGDDSWLNGVLEAWDNPIFRPVERAIQQVYLHEHGSDSDQKHRHHNSSTRERIDQAFIGTAATGTSKLSREGLKDAQIVAQLDKKFVLAKIRNATDTASELERHQEVLLLIDQHAADERIRVEALFTELCKELPAGDMNRGYRSKLGHTSRIAFTILQKPIQFAVSPQEESHFSTYAAEFASWGILYDVLPATSTSAKRQWVLSVTTLPPVISERCKANPQALIAFLRSAVWKYAEGTLATFKFDEAHGSTSWVRQVASCPDGVLDLVNSRACRSAIMFNDEMSLQECEELVQRLSKCVFPFMCAHGRPSMVPLVNIGFVREQLDFGPGTERSPNTVDTKKGFLDAWKAWKKK